MAAAMFLQPLSAPAALSFVFDYSSAPDFDATSKASLESAAATVGGWFNNTGTLTMMVTSSNANTSTLASAGSNFPAGGSAGFGNRGVVGLNILNGGDANGSTADGVVDVNFFHNWDFDDDIAAGAFDFKSTMMHELLHAIGFSSSINQNGTDPFGTPAGSSNGMWAPFDQFVADSSGNLINSGTFALDASRWNAAHVGGTGANGLFFNGSNAVAANGGNPVNLYSPNPWEDGSSGSHLDDDFFTSQALLMEAATDTGPGARTLSAVEIGMFRDLGFDMVPEPSSGVLLVSGGLMLVMRRRRF